MLTKKLRITSKLQNTIYCTCGVFLVDIIGFFGATILSILGLLDGFLFWSMIWDSLKLWDTFWLFCRCSVVFWSSFLCVCLCYIVSFGLLLVFYLYDIIVYSWFLILLFCLHYFFWNNFHVLSKYYIVILRYFFFS